MRRHDPTPPPPSPGPEKSGRTPWWPWVGGIALGLGWVAYELLPPGAADRLATAWWLWLPAGLFALAAGVSVLWSPPRPGPDKNAQQKSKTEG